jgi:hypothetical protein
VTTASSAQPPAIVSASLNADLPADHGAWFMRRVAAGWCRIGRRDGIHYRRVGLTREAVAGFVFWTRNVAPFLPCLSELRRLGYPCVLQHALTGYTGRPDVAHVDVAKAVDAFTAAARELGPRGVVWRYDPIVVDTATPSEWHLADFGRLARLLAGATDEVSIAFARPARAGAGGAGRLDHSGEAKRELVRALAVVAREQGMRLTLCSQPDWLARGAAPARCIDARRLADVGAGELDVGSSGFVPGCLCARAIDLGDSEGARPCYAGAVPSRVRRSAADPDREVLLPPRQTFARMEGELPF